MYYIAYIRVSTMGQSLHGTSLAEQRSAIQRYAERHELQIDRWVEEVQSASRKPRRVFKQLVIELASKISTGLIIHKIDRGARNLRD